MDDGENECIGSLEGRKELSGPPNCAKVVTRRHSIATLYVGFLARKVMECPGASTSLVLPPLALLPLFVLFHITR